jgi:4-hydroxybenzoate polyprenyltransferase
MNALFAVCVHGLTFGLALVFGYAMHASRFSTAVIAYFACIVAHVVAKGLKEHLEWKGSR